MEIKEYICDSYVVIQIGHMHLSPIKQLLPLLYIYISYVLLNGPWILECKFVYFFFSVIFIILDGVK